MNTTITALPNRRVRHATKQSLLRLAAAGALVAIAACEGPTDPGPATLRIALDVSALTGQQTVGRVSVVRDVVLTVESATDTNTQTKTLLPTDSIAVFDVAVDPGDVDFHVDILSNTGVPLYVADTTVAISADDFVVAITIRPVAPVMVVSPDTAIATLGPPQTQQFLSATLTVRNAGNDTLTWTFDRAASQDSFFCSVPTRTSCDNVPVAPGTGIPARFFPQGIIAPGNYSIAFISPQGTVVATIRIP